MAKIPPRKKQLPDIRRPLLESWCKLFEEIDPKIQTFHFYQENFKDELEKVLDIDFEYWVTEKARFLVLLPKGFDDKYLVGCSQDRMFSDIGVKEDDLIYEEDPYPCEPRTKQWKEFYQKITKISNNFKKEIPQLP